MSESYKDMKMEVCPVGVVESPIKEPSMHAVNGTLELKEKLKIQHRRIREQRKMESRLIIDPALGGILDGIEDFSHVLVVYWPHLASEEQRSLRQTHPMGRNDLPIKGVFSTCSPARPNPILVSCVRLNKREENTLYVTGLDAVDGSPILDIKPFLLGYPKYEKVQVAEWIEQIYKDLEEE